MSEQAPFTPADERLRNWDANKAKHEAQQYEAEMYGDAGTTDFSDHAKQRLQEAGEYESHLKQMQERGSEYNPADALLDAAENGEHQDAIDRAIAADPTLRRMQRLATDVAELGSAKVTADNESRLSARLKDKEDKLAELLVKFNDESTLSAGEKDDIINRIINSTDKGEAVAEDATEESDEPEASAPSTSETDGAAESEAHEADTADPEQHDTQPAFDVDAEVAAARQRLDDVARQREQQAVDNLNATDQARQDREILGKVSTEGLEDLEDDEAAVEAGAEPLESISTEGLEDEPAAGESDEQEADDNGEENENTSTPEQTRKGRIKRAWGAFSKAFDRASVATGYGLTKVSQRFMNRGGRKEDESDEAYEARQRKYGRRLILGTVAVAGASLALKLGSSIDLPGGEDGPSGSSNGLESLLTDPLDIDPASGNDYSKEALRVHDGEGLFSTFKQMGIPESKWQSVLDESGPKLVKMGEAYRDPSIGGYGLNGDGRLSRQALDVISESAKNV